MARLNLSFLGPFQASLDGKPLNGFESSKVRALLVYLSVESGRPHSRETLCGLLWPDWPQASALSSLRNALADLRKNLDDAHADPPFLLITRDSLQFNPEGDYSLDIAQFQSLLQSAQSTKDLQSAINNQQSAISLYRGPFLEGFCLPDNNPFEEWLEVEREYLKQMLLGALQRLADAYEQEGEMEQALAMARRQLVIEPWLEEEHRRAMRLLALSGQRGAALAQYESCRELLDKELGVEPGTETRSLYEAIRDGSFEESGPQAKEPISKFSPGMLIHKRYRLEEVIGRGGIGVIYCALDTLLNRQVAIKVLHNIGLGTEGRAKLLREAQIVAKLNHPNIVAIYDAGEVSKIPYLVMELINGTPLDQMIPLPVDQILILTTQICSALEYAHGQGIVHRDLKPGNILLEQNGQAKLMDFGLARSAASQITTEGAIAGTVFYMAPEQALGKEIDARSDLYSLGVILYELATGEVPFNGEDPLAIISQHLHAPVVPPRLKNEDIPEVLNDLILQLLCKEPKDRPESAGEVLKILDRISKGEPQQPAPGPCPYKGLQFFDEADAELFFGREALVGRLLERVLPESIEPPCLRFLVVTGASGSGKSSVVRAGIVPAVHRQARSVVVVLTPTTHPLESLAAALTQDSESVTATATLMDDLAHDPRSLHLFARRAISEQRAATGDQGMGTGDKGLAISEKRSGKSDQGVRKNRDPKKLLLVIDQFEEVFTQCREENERKAFIDNLVNAAGSPDGPVFVLLALRADFYAACAPYENLRQVITQNQEFIGPMSAEELRRAIDEPAKLGGWELEPGLSDLFLRDVGVTGDRQSAEPGMLPLLSHALLETWLRRQGRTLTLSGYEEAGGVHGAIIHTAESVYARLSPAEQSIARDIFLRLTELGEGTQETRRRAPLAELVPTEGESPALCKEAQLVLKTLVDARLVTANAETVEVAHEALIRVWGRLQEWLNEDREGLRLHRRLTEAAGEWEGMGREEGLLYRGARLAQVQEWALAHPGVLNRLEREFLQASRGETEREAAEREAQRQRELEAAQRLAKTERRAAQRLRRRAIYLGASLIAAFALAVIAFGSTRVAVNSAKVASTNARLATARELAAAALNNLEEDQERALLLAMQSVKTADLPESESALHQAFGAAHLKDSMALNNSNIAGNSIQNDYFFGLAFSPDGKRFATISFPRSIQIWELENTALQFKRTPLRTININYLYKGHSSHSIMFSPDGHKLAALSSDKTASIWDVDSGEIIQTFASDPNNILSVAFSPNGELLATGIEDQSVIIWDVQTGKELQLLPRQYDNLDTSNLKININTNTPSFVALFSRDGEQLATGGSSGVASIWKRTGKQSGSSDYGSFTFVANIQEQYPIIDALAFSPDGKQLAIGACEYIQIYNVGTLSPTIPPQLVKSTLFPEGWCLQGLYYTPDGKRLVGTSSGTRAKVWDIDTGQELMTLGTNNGSIVSSALNLEGTRLLTILNNSSIRLWDISLISSQEWITLPEINGDSRFSLDGTHLATLTSEEIPKISLLELTVEGSKQVKIIDPGKSSFCCLMDTNADFTRLVTAQRLDYDRIIKIWDTVTGQLITSFSAGKAVVSNPVLNQDGTRLAINVGNWDIHIWDLEKQKQIFIKYGNYVLTDGAFSPDGTQLVTGHLNSGDVRIWDVSTGNLIKLLKASSVSTQAKFCPDGKRVVTSSDDGSVMLWNAETGNLLLSLNIISSGVGDVDCSLKGNYLGTSTYNGTVEIWDASTGQELLRFPGFSIFFTKDGKHLITRNFNFSKGIGSASAYSLDIQDVMVLARSRLTRSWTPEECQQFLHTDTCPPAP